MFIEHPGKRPRIHPSAGIAANAIGEHCVIMEHAALRGTSRAPLEVGNHVLVGPHAHLSGCHPEDDYLSRHTHRCSRTPVSTQAWATCLRRCDATRGRWRNTTMTR